MNKNSLKLKRLFFVLALVISCTTSVFAADNVISSVVISKSKDKANSYELNIDSTYQVQYKSHIDGNNNVYFDLKDSSLAPNLGTIYDDVTDIDNVTVKQLDKSRVRIYVNGNNARNTELIFTNSIFEPARESAKKIVINRPINEYKSTSLDDLEYIDDSQEWDDNSFNLYHFSSIVLSELKNGPAGKVLILLSLFAFLAILVKSLSSKISQEKEPLIGLNNSKYLNNEIKIGSIGATFKPNENNSIIQKTSNRNATIAQAQAELTKAHQKYQQYIQNKYQGLQKPKSIDTDTLKKSLALNQYQKSTQNPYKNQEVLRINKGYSGVEIPKGNFQIPPRPQTPQKAEFTSPYIKKTNNFIDVNIKKEQPKNMKFLESVSKIYERSGRGDLANELKNSISKAKQTI